jgi:hypothetical protein
MTQTPEEPGTAVRDLIDRLFDGIEPPHRPGMADTTIAYGRAAATRRRGFAVAGAAAGVLAVAAGAAVVGGGWRGGGQAGPGTGNPSWHGLPPTYEYSNPSYPDKIREIETELPGMLTPLLPAGMTVGFERESVNTGQNGVVSPVFTLRTATGNARWQVDTEDAGYERFFSEDPATKAVPVDGGSLRVRTLHSARGQYSTYVEYTPADKHKPMIRFEIDGSESGAAPLDAEVFVKLVNAPGFAAIATLVDPATPASHAAVLQRYQMESRINADAASLLPAGFLFRLDPVVPGMLDLVGPDGVNVFEWHTTDVPTKCSQSTLCYQGSIPYSPVGMDGKSRTGFYEYTVHGITVYINVFPTIVTAAGTDPVKVGIQNEQNTTPVGSGLTPQEALAIAKAPNVAQVIAQVNQDLNP